MNLNSAFVKLQNQQNHQHEEKTHFLENDQGWQLISCMTDPEGEKSTSLSAEFQVETTQIYRWNLKN